MPGTAVEGLAGERFADDVRPGAARAIAQRARWR